jgi:DNA-binding XRE family transcriptional regulator
MQKTFVKRTNTIFEIEGSDDGYNGAIKIENIKIENVEYTRDGDMSTSFYDAVTATVTVAGRTAEFYEDVDDGSLSDSPDSAIDQNGSDVITLLEDVFDDYECQEGDRIWGRILKEIDDSLSKDLYVNTMNFPIILKRLRKECGWTVEKMAETLQISKRTIDGWEQGREPGKAVIPLLQVFLDNKDKLELKVA